MEPAIFADTAVDMRVNQEEMFAPITCVIRVSGFDEAVEVANGTPFGLTAGIVTRSLARSQAFKARSKSGCVMVNLATAGTDYHVPFGGVGQSSYGPREQGQYAIDFYTIVKTAYTAPGDPR
jgi:aldehyde dehydrogenase (NAD+)